MKRTSHETSNLVFWVQVPGGVPNIRGWVVKGSGLQTRFIVGSNPTGYSNLVSYSNILDEQAKFCLWCNWFARTIDNREVSVRIRLITRLAYVLVSQWQRRTAQTRFVVSSNLTEDTSGQVLHSLTRP